MCYTSLFSEWLLTPVRQVAQAFAAPPPRYFLRGDMWRPCAVWLLAAGCGLLAAAVIGLKPHRFTLCGTSGCSYIYRYMYSYSCSDTSTAK